jgi:hypothetical protein
MRTECVELGGEMMTIKDWLTMRNDVGGMYTIFFEKFVVQVVGVARYRSKVSSQFLSSFVTIGDEAFALLVLENCEEKWVDMHSNGVTKSKMKNKYTDGGSSAKSGRSRMLKGWSNKGLNRFNELFKMVKKDRERKDVTFEGTFLNKTRDKGQGRKRKRMVMRVVEDDDEPCEYIEDEMELTEV